MPMETPFGRCAKAASSAAHRLVCADNVRAIVKLSNKRRVVVSKFSGKLFVNIREYYEDKSGDMKPGKKVSFQALCTVATPVC